MSSTFFHKPELALRRALELQSIKQSEAALFLLHEVLSSRRHRTWSPTYEQIMITYLNLCLSLHKAREAKDGLHQYRNLSQSQAPGSLEKVIRYLMDAAEKKCTDAKASADALADAVLDEDSAEASSHILLSNMSADPTKTQRDTALLLPSLKFLWETYRAVLDILKSNSKLEHVYHAAAMGALKFCRTYKRRTEFRRLCDMLRLHLGNLQKYGSLQPIVDEANQKSQNGKVRGWEGWSTESIELHLQTRFSQLETASVLHLYTEGFRTVEDIYNILQVSQARRKVNAQAPPVKAKLMAAYYEKLTTLFWVSENYLFHAFAWYKYYTLCKEFNRSMSDEMKEMQASAVLLAALCIPTHAQQAKQAPQQQQQQQQQQHGISSTVEDDIVKEKMARMATLLGFHTRHPTRDALLIEIRANHVMDNVPAYLKDLYVLLEENSDPLVMVDQAKPLLEKLKKEVAVTNETDNEDFNDNTLGRYVTPLTSVLLLKLLLNLSAAYHTVSLDHLKRLTEGLCIPFDKVESAIVLFTQTKTLSVRIDHRAGCLRFGDPELESDAMRSQLTTLSKKLKTLVDTTIAPVDPTVKLEARKILFDDIRSKAAMEHAAILERKNVILGRKEETERVAQEKTKKAELLRMAEDVARKEEEEKRVAREQRLREKEKLRKIQKEMEATEKKKYLQALGRNVDAMTEEEVNQIDTAALAKEHADKANKKKEEIERKAREEAKRLDYLVRAVRIEELPLVKARYEEKITIDRARYEAEVIEKAQRAREQWEADVKEKATLQAHSVFECLAEFEDMAMAGRKKFHKELCKAEDHRAELEAEMGKLKRARKRKDDEAKLQAEEEKRLKAEAEAAQLAEAQALREEEKRRKAAEDERKRQAELTRMQDERDRKERERRPPPFSRELDSGGGSKSGGGSYVPPSLRNRDAGGSGGPSRFGDRGGGYGGGRYEGRQFGGSEGRSGDGRGGDGRGGDGRGGSGFDARRRDDRGGTFGGDRGGERRGGGFDDRRRDDRGGAGGGSSGGAGGGSRRW